MNIEDLSEHLAKLTEENTRLKAENKELKKTSDDLQIKNRDLNNENFRLQGDINELAYFIIAVFKGLGVNDFSDFDNVGNIVMKALPGILKDKVFAPHRIDARFAFFKDAAPLMKKYEHLLPKKENGSN